SVNKFGISQSISFPTVYANQKKLLYEEWNSAAISVKLNKLDIRKTVSELFYKILDLREREKILNRTDEMYKGFLEKASLRMENGESNLLEKTAAEVQRENIAIQLKALANEIELAKIQFQLMLNADTRYEPSASDIVVMDGLFDTNTDIAQHPVLQLSAQEIEKAKASVRLEKSRLLP